MSVTLPTTPAAPAEFDPYFYVNGVKMRPVLGGPEFRLSRLGDRFGVRVRYAPMPYTDAMAWFAAMAKANSDTVLLPIVQPDFTIGATGTPLVNGAAQAGTSLNIDGLTAGYAAKAGQFFSHVGASYRYLYMLTADKTATGGGVAAATPIWPMIQSSPADNAVLEFAAPILEGWIQDDMTSWTVNRIMAEGIAFDILQAG